MPPHIRPYTPADFDQTVTLLRELQLHLAAVDKDNIITCSDDFGPAELTGYLNDSKETGGAVFVAEDNDVLIGFVQGVIWKHDDAEYLRAHRTAAVDGWVGLLVVSPEARGKGTGKALLVHMERYFKDHGCTQCRIKVSAHNEATRVFYDRSGYRDRDVEIMKAL